jgi:hypothetical protein
VLAKCAIAFANFFRLFTHVAKGPTAIYPHLERDAPILLTANECKQFPLRYESPTCGG